MFRGGQVREVKGRSGKDEESVVKFQKQSENVRKVLGEFWGYGENLGGRETVG